MNKYQEALKWFESIYEVLGQEQYYEDLGLRFGQGLKESLETVKKLVDKETPMKPIYIQGFSTNRKKVKLPLCGKCSINLVVDYVKLRRCINDKCNQVVDWSDEE